MGRTTGKSGWAKQTGISRPVRVLRVRSFATTLLAALLMTGSFAQEANAEVGESVVYLERDGNGRYVPTADNQGHTRVLANLDSITPPAVSPSRNRVAFSGGRGDGSLGRYAIFVVDFDGSNLRRLTNGSHAEFDPVWVDNGTLIISQNVTGSITGNCCRLASVSVSSGRTTAITGSIGAQRPVAIPNGTYVFFDTSEGVWRMRTGGGSRSLVAPWGYDAAVAESESEIAFVRKSGSSTHLRRVSSSGGASTLLYTTPNEIENPVWIGNRIYFVEHQGLGYDGRKSVTLRSITRTGGSPRVERSFSKGVVGVGPGSDGDEMFFYRSDGLYRYYNTAPDASLGTAIRAGEDYTSGWSSITSVNLDGDASDEMFFYRGDGLYRFYEIGPDAALGSPIRAGEDYTEGWDSITAVDLDGDGRDEMFFYREDGLYRYYNIRPNGRLGSPIRAGEDYTEGWDSITAVDLDGDGHDEMFFYREDGLYRYYDIRSNATIGSPIRAGSDYTSGWSSISAIDLDGDGQDEMFFYRDDGLYRYYNVSSNATLGSPIRAGSDYTSGWTSITSVNLPSG